MAAWSLASWSGVLRAAFERILIHIRFMYETLWNHDQPGSTRMNRARLSRSEHSVFVTLDDEPDDAAGLPEMSWSELRDVWGTNPFRGLDVRNTGCSNGTCGICGVLRLHAAGWAFPALQSTFYVYGTSIGCYRYIHLILHDLTCCNLLSCVVIYCD